MDKALLDHLAHFLSASNLKVTPVSGGDISQAFLLEAKSERFFCKVNQDVQASAMFLAEKSGLEAIALTKTIAVPRVLLCEGWKASGLLLMEYIEPKRASSGNMELFGHQLAALHMNAPAERFGGKADNFIGSLPQSNKEHNHWTDFYIHERLLPQLKMAYDSQRLAKNEIPSEARLLKACYNLFPEVVPALLHGDLWSGNYLISEKGIPHLIDPATYFGHHEVDIAMTRLFGGFDSSFYNAYFEHFSEIDGEKQRTDLYQLYYLLVHLNLFGRSYKSSVTSTIKTYF